VRRPGQHRNGARAPAAHRARSAPPALRACLAAATHCYAHSALVCLASTPPSAGETRSYPPSSTLPISATVVLVGVYRCAPPRTQRWHGGAHAKVFTGERASAVSLAARPSP